MSTLLKSPSPLPIDQVFLCSFSSPPITTYPTQLHFSRFNQFFQLKVLIILTYSSPPEEMKDDGRNQGTMSPCAACKLLRRRCAQDCVFAPYFPADEPHKFASVHKVFGASNVNKMLQVQFSGTPFTISS